ncbi:MAG TPA: zf-HC2 domain-containing protein [Myxococcales bacterium]
MTKRCAEIVPLLGPYADGAAASDDREEVARHLEECARCPDRLRFFTAQGDAIREAVRRRAEGADFHGFADKVLARARKEKPQSYQGLSVWTREMLGAHRGAFGAAGVVLAACMALAVVFIPQPPVADDGTPDPQSRIEEVDFGTHDGAVLQLPNETTVIWMSDDRGAAR